MNFLKMHGIGNDFVMVDASVVSEPTAGWAALARAMCHRRFGVGSDGLILLERSSSALRMRMLNPDGTESEMCGNGLRCFAKWIRKLGYVDGDTFDVDMGARRVNMQILSDGRVRVAMGLCRFERGAIGMAGDPDANFIKQDLGVHGLKGTAVSIGNPHLVCVVDDAGAIPLHDWGPVLERHELFPSHVNVHFVSRGRDSIIQRTWERGAGETMACGSGACAVAATAVRIGMASSPVQINLPGGNLEIEIDRAGHAFMTGPAEFVYEGIWPD